MSTIPGVSKDTLALFIRCVRLNPGISADNECWPNVLAAYAEYEASLEAAQKADEF